MLVSALQRVAVLVESEIYVAGALNAVGFIIAVFRSLVGHDRLLIGSCFRLFDDIAQFIKFKAITGHVCSIAQNGFLFCQSPSRIISIGRVHPIGIVCASKSTVAIVGVANRLPFPVRHCGETIETVILIAHRLSVGIGQSRDVSVVVIAVADVVVCKVIVRHRSDAIETVVGERELLVVLLYRGQSSVLVIFVLIDSIVRHSSQIVVGVVTLTAVGFRKGLERSLFVVVKSFCRFAERYRLQQVGDIVVAHRGDTALCIGYIRQVVVGVIGKFRTLSDSIDLLQHLIHIVVAIA